MQLGVVNIILTRRIHGNIWFTEYLQELCQWYTPLQETQDGHYTAGERIGEAGHTPGWVDTEGVARCQNLEYKTKTVVVRKLKVCWIRVTIIPFPVALACHKKGLYRGCLSNDTESLPYFKRTMLPVDHANLEHVIGSTNEIDSNVFGL